MGQLLIKASEKLVSEDFEAQLFTLKKTDLKMLYECIELIDEQYPTSYRLLPAEFDAIFGLLIDDTEPIFQRLSERVSSSHDARMVDVYEALAFFALFSGDTFENKILFVYRLFDFDSSDTLEKQELIFTISSVIKSLCKIVGVPPPKSDFLESLADACFLMIDQDNSKHIEFSEFQVWVDQNYDFQDFLLRYSGTQCAPNAKRRMKSILGEYEEGFLKKSKGSVTMDVSSVESLVQQQLADFKDKELIGYVVQVIVETSKRYQETSVSSFSEVPAQLLINKRDYLDVMRAWCAFSACDAFNTNLLSVHDLRILLWIYEDEKPSAFKLLAEMQRIDEDRSKTIDRKEWIRYLCSEERTGGNVFRGSLKRNFEKYEKPNGLVDTGNVRDILRDVFKQKIEKNSKNISNLENINKLIEKLSQDITKDLRSKELAEFCWQDFRIYIESAIEKNKKLCQYLDSNI